MSDFYCCSGMNIGEIKETIENLNSSIEDLDSQEIKVPFTVGKNGLLITPSDFFDKMPALITGKKFIGGLHNLNPNQGLPIADDQIVISNKYFYYCDFSDFSGDFLFDNCIFDTCVMFDVTNDYQHEGYRILDKYYPEIEKNGKEAGVATRPSSGKICFSVCVPTSCTFINPSQNIAFTSVQGMTSTQGKNTVVFRKKEFNRKNFSSTILKANYGIDYSCEYLFKLVFENCSFAQSVDVDSFLSAWDDNIIFEGCRGLLSVSSANLAKMNQYSTPESLINFVGAILAALYADKTNNEYTYFWNSPSAAYLNLSNLLTSNADVVEFGKYLQQWDCTSGRSEYSTSKSNGFNQVAKAFANSLQNLQRYDYTQYCNKLNFIAFD